MSYIECIVIGMYLALGVAIFLILFLVVMSLLNMAMIWYNKRR